MCRVLVGYVTADDNRRWKQPDVRTAAATQYWTDAH